jgi:hypothetical protein
MTSPTRKPSLEDVLGAFSVEPDPGRETLAAYLRRYPQFAEPLIDLSRELHRAPAVPGPDTAEDEARIAEAWRRHSEALDQQAQEDFLTALSTQQLRDISKTLDVPRQVITAFRDRRVILDSVPPNFLSRFAAAVDQPLERLAACLAPITQPFTQPALARSHKSDTKPTAGEPVTFERVLIDAGVPEDKRARLLTDSG